MIIIDGKQFYGIVYKITNQINQKSYIGITTNKRGFNGRYNCKGDGIERVYKYHKTRKENGGCYNTHLLCAIEKYGFDAFEICEVLDTAIDEEELSQKEMYYIDLFDSFNNGYNNTLGGEIKGLGQHKGKDNPLSTQICQLTLSGELVKIWGSFGEIRRSGLYNVPNIELTCQGVNSQSYGYLWVYKQDYDSKKSYEWKPSNNYKAIVLLDDNNNVIKEFISIKEASEYLHADRTTIRAACNHKWENPKHHVMFKKDYLCMEEQRLNEETLVELDK